VNEKKVDEVNQVNQKMKSVSEQKTKILLENWLTSLTILTILDIN